MKLKKYAHSIHNTFLVVLLADEMVVCISVGLHLISVPVTYSYLQVSQDMSFLCISSDAEKLTVFAYATDAALALKEGEGGLRANDWVSRTLSVREHMTCHIMFCPVLSCLCIG